MENYIVNLNDLKQDGMISLPCDKCHRMVLWDFDHKVAYKATVRKFVS